MIDEGTRDVIISSCCHSVNLLIQKYFPEELDFSRRCDFAHAGSLPGHKKALSRRKNGLYRPLRRKKDEAQYYEGFVDAVLTFDELTAWLKAENIELKRELDQNEHSRARFFPTTGGILKTMTKDNPDYTYMAIDGTENCIAALKDIESGKIHHCFIEMSACAGSCVGGPVMEKFHRSPVKDFVSVAKFSGKEDFEVEQPDRRSLGKDFTVIERRLLPPSEKRDKGNPSSNGKDQASDELNCGSCGYNTCREKGRRDLSRKGRDFHVSALS